jgi:photosystem II stability/assembly factor-like uncharacterized protein
VAVILVVLALSVLTTLATWAALPPSSAAKQTGAERAGAGSAGEAEPTFMPFVLAPDTGLFDQFGYAPAYTRNVPAFDSSGRAYIRSRTSSGGETSYVHTLAAGSWARLDFLRALRAAYPAFATTVGAGGLRNDGIVFDRQDRAYNPVTVQLRDGSIRSCLLVSWDHCRTWKVFKLPNGTFTVERWVGHNELDGPPFLALWRESAPPDLPGSQTNALFVTQPRLEGEQLVLPRLVKVTDRCLGLSRDSGGASFAVTKGGTTWFVWSEVAAKGKGGTPHYVSTYDRATNTIGARRKLATSPQRSDTHDKPGICLDSAGVLHVVAGGHNSPALYTRSLAPLSADAGWTVPVPVLSTGWASATDPLTQLGRQTYPAFVYDSRDTLHLVTRQFRRGVDPYHDGQGYGALVHQACPAGGGWSEPTVVVAGAHTGYSVFFHKLALDARDRLFLSCSYQGGPELDSERMAGVVRAVLGRDQLRPGKYRGRMLLVSEDGGATWRFAADADLAPAGEAVVPAQRAPEGRAAAGSPAPALAWRWLNPLPQGNQLTSAAFSGTSSGWTVGTHGAVWRTTDGGSSWIPQNAPVVSDLFSVAAASRSRAWAVGADGLIIRTGDGGATWAVVPSGTDRDLFGVCAVSVLEGWAVGERGTVLHTTDGGVTWVPAARPTSETLLAVTFSDRVHGLACGTRGTLMRTRDGGRTWKRRRSLTNSPLLSVALLKGGAAAACGADGSLVLSKNVGWTWTKVNTKTRDTLRAVRLRAGGRVWVLAPRTVLRSVDGGCRWRRARLPVPGPCGALAVLSKSVLVAGGAGGALCRSIDAGVRWAAFSSGVRDDLHALAAASPWVVAAGANGVVLTTDSGGVSWSTAIVDPDEDLEAVALGSSGTWVAGTNGTVAHRDGSGAWIRLPAVTAEDLHAIAAPSADAVVAAGDAGTLLTSLNGGLNWRADHSLEDDLFALAFSDGLHGWAGGGARFGETRAEVLRTDDGGMSWTRLDLPAWGRVRGLCFTGAQTGWAAVEDWGVDGDRPQGSVYMTADGGQTWVRQTCAQRVLLGVAMEAGGAGWAWGEDGLVLHTVDGGAGWLQVDAGTGSALAGGVLLPSGEVWLAGEAGGVLAGAPAAATSAGAP